MKHTRILLSTVVIALLLLPLALPAQQVAHPHDLRYGPHPVGFRSMVLFDTTRTYDLTCGDTTIHIGNRHPGRPLVVNVWYPAAAPGKEPLRIEQLWDVAATPDTRHFLAMFKRFQEAYARMYSVDETVLEKDLLGDPALLQQVRDTAFRKYRTLRTASFRDAPPLEGDFPLVVYHQGLGGTMEENQLVLELLASHGYIAVSSGFQHPEADMSLGAGNVSATLDDLGFIIRHRSTIHRGAAQVFLMGHSYGGNMVVPYVGLGRGDVAGLVLLDCDHFRALSDCLPLPSGMSPFAPERLRHFGLPILGVGSVPGRYRMTDSLSLAHRQYATVGKLRHNDFISIGAISRMISAPYVRTAAADQAAYNDHGLLCNFVLDFLNACRNKPFSFAPHPVGAGANWTFHDLAPGEKLPHNRPYHASAGTCPNAGQFIDLVHRSSAAASVATYMRCKEVVDAGTDGTGDIVDALWGDMPTDTVIAFLQGLANKDVHVRQMDLFAIGTDYMAQRLGSTERRAAAEEGERLFVWMTRQYPDSLTGYLGLMPLLDELEGRDYRSSYGEVVRIDPGIAVRAKASRMGYAIKRMLSIYGGR